MSVYYSVRFNKVELNISNRKDIYNFLYTNSLIQRGLELDIDRYEVPREMRDDSDCEILEDIYKLEHKEFDNEEEVYKSIYGNNNIEDVIDVIEVTKTNTDEDNGTILTGYMDLVISNNKHNDIENLIILLIPYIKKGCIFVHDDYSNETKCVDIDKMQRFHKEYIENRMKTGLESYSDYCMLLDEIQNRELSLYIEKIDYNNDMEYYTSVIEYVESNGIDTSYVKEKMKELDSEDYYYSSNESIDLLKYFLRGEIG